MAWWGRGSRKLSILYYRFPPLTEEMDMKSIGEIVLSILYYRFRYKGVDPEVWMRYAYTFNSIL